MPSPSPITEEGRASGCRQAFRPDGAGVTGYSCNAHWFAINTGFMPIDSVCPADTAEVCASMVFIWE